MCVCVCICLLSKNWSNFHLSNRHSRGRVFRLLFASTCFHPIIALFLSYIDLLYKQSGMAYMPRVFLFIYCVNRRCGMTESVNVAGVGSCAKSLTDEVTRDV